MQLARQIIRIRHQSRIVRYPPWRGSPIAIRVNSDIKILDNILSEQAMDQLLGELLNEEKHNKYKACGDLDTSIGIEGLSGFELMPMLQAIDAA